MAKARWGRTGKTDLLPTAHDLLTELAMTMVSLVVMENGSAWPGELGESANVVAFSQERDRLLRSTQEKLDALRRGRQDVEVAVLACNGQSDEDAQGCRAQVARTLLDAVRGAAFGRLVLSASSSASGPLRQGLLSLAGALTEQLQGTTATVSLRFVATSPGEERMRAARSRFELAGPIEAASSLP